MEEKKVGRAVNLYDKDTGFVYIVNLYIINYIYYHMKKHDAFIENNKGKKSKSYDLFGDIIHISRTRFSRITRIGKGRFELTPLEAEGICNKLGIDMKYFQKEAPVIIEFPGVTAEDWKCYLNKIRQIPYEEIDYLSVRVKREKIDRVKEALQSATDTDWRTRGVNEEENPVFQIWYYFKFNAHLKRKSNVDMMMSFLQEIKFHDWNKVNESKIKECYELLNRHCEFLKAYILLKQRLSEEK